MVVNGAGVKTSPSIGVAVYPEHGTAQDRLYKSADLALYEAKRMGGNRWCWYKARMAAGGGSARSPGHAVAGGRASPRMARRLPAALLSWLMKNYKYYDLILGAYVCVLLCANLIGPAKVTTIHVPAHRLGDLPRRSAVLSRSPICLATS